MRLLRHAASGALISAFAAATPAVACIDYAFAPLVAHARIRDQAGVWRAASVEASHKTVRLEYRHPRTPWGRLVIVGNISSGEAAVFPIQTTAPVPPSAREVWRTSLAVAVAEVGLTPAFFEAPLNAIGSDTGGIHRGWPCRFPEQLNDRDQLIADRSVCVHDSGLPLYVEDASGRRVFEVTSLQLRLVSRIRFTSPSTYRFVDQRPRYLQSFTC